MRVLRSRIMAHCTPAQLRAGDYVFQAESAKGSMVSAIVMYTDDNKFLTTLTREDYISKRTSQRNLISLKKLILWKIMEQM